MRKTIKNNKQEGRKEERRGEERKVQGLVLDKSKKNPTYDGQL
jgi:hypothetical protein